MTDRATTISGSSDSGSSVEGSTGAAAMSNRSSGLQIPTARERPTQLRMSSPRSTPNSFSISSAMVSVMSISASSMYPAAAMGSAKVETSDSIRSESASWSRSIVNTMSTSAGTADSAEVPWSRKFDMANTTPAMAITAAATIAISRPRPLLGPDATSPVESTGSPFMFSVVT